MDTPASFRVLGPLEVVAGGKVVEVGAGKLRVILATLLLHANRTVSMDELVERLWSGVPQHNPRGTVQKYVMRVRRLLGDGVDRGDNLIHTEPDGYRIVLGPGRLDVDRFDELCRDAARAAAAGDAAGESAVLTGALELWRGVPPLSNVPSEPLHRHEASELVERYLRTLDRRITVDLELGRHAELVGELAGLVHRYPVQERFWAHRIRALHGAGRQGEALAGYRDVARLLAEELGVDPGAELRAAHREVLDGPAAPASPGPRSAAPARATAGPAAAGPAWRPPRQLPMAPVPLVGREAELARVVEALEQAGPRRDAPVVISGLPGVGKTALALHAAHRVAARFPDGQLFVDMQGHDAGPPPGVQDVLGRFLRALGVPPSAVPPGIDEQVASYRSLLAGRRVLVVVDGAADVQSVRQLLPGSSGCRVVVTSRNELAGLDVAPGARRVTPDVLPASAGRALLAGVLGAAAVQDDEAAADELVGMCGGLPLALRVAAAHLMLRPGLRIADHVERLGPVSALRVDGDDRADVGAAFDRSYRRLPADHRRLFRLLGLLPGPEVSAVAAAAAASVPPSHAAAGLEALAAASLLARLPAGTYGMHVLLREYAARRSEVEDTAAERQRVRRSTQLRPAAQVAAVRPTVSVGLTSRFTSV